MIYRLQENWKVWALFKDFLFGYKGFHVERLEINFKFKFEVSALHINMSNSNLIKVKR